MLPLRPCFSISLGTCSDPCGRIWCIRRGARRACPRCRRRSDRFGPSGDVKPIPRGKLGRPVDVDRLLPCSLLTRHIVAAYLAGRLHRAVPANEGPTPAGGTPLATRGQARRIPCIARRDGERVGLQPPGQRFDQPFSADRRGDGPAAILHVDGEAVACDDSGVPSFDLLRHRKRDDHVFLNAFDLIESAGAISGANHSSNAKSISVGCLPILRPG